MSACNLESERVQPVRSDFGGMDFRERALRDSLPVQPSQQTGQLAEPIGAVSAQRKAIVQDLLDIAARAERQGEKWAQALLVIGLVLIVALLLMLFGLLLLYRRLLLRMMERHPPPAH